MDPSATTYTNGESPAEIAADRDFSEVLKILAEFTELPDKVKLLQLYNLMYFGNVDNWKEEFQSILQSVPVELVSFLFSYFLFPVVSHFMFLLGFLPHILKRQSCCIFKM